MCAILFVFAFFWNVWDFVFKYSPAVYVRVNGMIWLLLSRTLAIYAFNQYELLISFPCHHPFVVEAGGEADESR